MEILFETKTFLVIRPLALIQIDPPQSPHPREFSPFMGDE
jgi:hypothetical protein